MKCELERKQIVALMHQEVVPAMGCTEPVAVALAVAKATETLGSQPDKLRVVLSANMLKNAMGVGIPGTGMIGLPIAIALGAIIGKSSYGLEVLKDVSAEAVALGKSYIDGNHIKIELAPDAPSKLYIDVCAEHDDDSARVVIACSHENFVLIEHNGEVLLSKDNISDVQECSSPRLRMKDVYEFAVESPLEELQFIKEAAKLNKNAAKEAFNGEYGHSLGRIIREKGVKYFGNTTLAHMLSYTSAACDVRMGGAPIAVMSNSGSGNQGITATMPVVSFAEDCGADEEHTVRALALSHLTSIYIKQSLGRLSALCGCVVASTGASAGIVYLMGGDYGRVCSAVKNMVANLTGMICDGAKPSCAMKISSGVSTALMSALLAMNNQCATSAEGIVADDVDDTVNNLTMIGRDAMTETDKLVLNIMLNK
jgi:L-cysteine desulfidase